MAKRRRVNLDRLRAALQATGGSRQQVAKTASLQHSTLSRIVSARGATKIVDAATLQKLSGALRVSVEWLTREQRALPYVPEWDQLHRKGAGPSLWEQPSASVVRYSWLMQGIEKAIRRDLLKWYGEEEGGQTYDSWGQSLFAVFEELSNFVSWRTACLVSPVGSWSVLWPSDNSPSFDWLEQLLEPWIAGRAYLNARVLRSVFTALLSNPERMWESDRDAKGLLGLEQYEEARDKFAPASAFFESLGPEDD